MMIILPIIGNAQLKIEERLGRWDKIGCARLGAVRVFEGRDTCCLAIKSSNECDATGIFYLGETKKSAYFTLKDMVALYKQLEVGEWIMVVDASGERCYISRYASPTLLFRFKGLSGNCYVTKWEMKRLLDIVHRQL